MVSISKGNLFIMQTQAQRLWTKGEREKKKEKKIQESNYCLVWIWNFVCGLFRRSMEKWSMVVCASGGTAFFGHKVSFIYFFKNRYIYIPICVLYIYHIYIQNIVLLLVFFLLLLLFAFRTFTAGVIGRGPTHNSHRSHLIPHVFWCGPFCVCEESRAYLLNGLFLLKEAEGSFVSH